MRPGEPATCSAAVRAIWLARPGTSVSKVSAGLSRLREGNAAAAAWATPLATAPASLPFLALAWPFAPAANARAAQGRVEVDRAPRCCRHAVARRALPSRCASVTSRRTGLPASSLRTVSIRPAY